LACCQSHVVGPAVLCNAERVRSKYDPVVLAGTAAPSAVVVPDPLEIAAPLKVQRCYGGAGHRCGGDDGSSTGSDESRDSEEARGEDIDLPNLSFLQFYFSYSYSFYESVPGTLLDKPGSKAVTSSTIIGSASGIHWRTLDLTVPHRTVVSVDSICSATRPSCDENRIISQQ
jgi:hypothetical protein